MSYLSSCCISLHVRVCACVRAHMHALCPFPSFIWKWIHWVLFPLAMPYSIALVWPSWCRLIWKTYHSDICSNTICWVYIWSFAHSAVAASLKMGSYSWSGDWLTIHRLVCLFAFSSVVVIAPWFRPRKRKSPFFVYFLVWGQVSCKGEERKMLRV